MGNEKSWLHVDHVIPWSSGGETIPENLRAACSDCNLGKGGQGVDLPAQLIEAPARARRKMRDVAKFEAVPYGFLTSLSSSLRFSPRRNSGQFPIWRVETCQ